MKSWVNKRKLKVNRHDDEMGETNDTACLIDHSSAHRWRGRMLLVTANPNITEKRHFSFSKSTI